MDDARIYLIAQFDEETEERLSGIYGELARAGLTGEQTKGIPYHFTMGSFALECRDEVLARVQAVCSQTKAFDIGMSHIGLFGTRVLFIAPSMNRELISLHDDLVPGESASGCHSWVAHATLLIDSPENMGTAIPIVAQSFSPFSAKVKSIGVYEFFPGKFIGEYELL